MKNLNQGFQDGLFGLDQAIDDDEDGWKALFKNIQWIVGATIQRYKPTDAYVEAEDILQDVFVTLLKNDRTALRNLKDRSFPEQRSYLIEIAISRCNDYGRNSAKEKKILSRGDPESAVESYEQPDTGLCDKVIAEMRRTAFPLLLDRLSSQQAEVLKLKAAGNRGKEIADKLEMRENTVYSHQRRGIAALKTLAAELFPELCGGATPLGLFLVAR
jgi:RNA polymerase sigma factor (sigma-70 family)